MMVKFKRSKDPNYNYTCGDWKLWQDPMTMEWFAERINPRSYSMEFISRAYLREIRAELAKHEGNQGQGSNP